MKLYEPVVSFELASRELAEKFLKSCGTGLKHPSFGGVHTTAERRRALGRRPGSGRFHSNPALVAKIAGPDRGI